MPEKAHSHADPWDRLQWFLGFDWAKDEHEVVVLEPRGRIVLRRTVPNTAEGWDGLREALRDLAGDDLAVVGIAIETSRGPDVDRLLDLGCTVYPVHPVVSKRLRERKALPGVKDNELDAWALGDGLRTDGHAWRRLRPDSDPTRTLRMLCRDEVALIEQRTALVNQLRAALREYYPAALEAFTDWTMPAAWSFLTRFPTPAKLARAGKRAWEKFLHTHRLARPQTYERRLEVFARAEAFCGHPAVIEAKSVLAVAIAKQLQCLDRQLKGYRKQIEKLYQKHEDHGIYSSLPAMGPTLGPRILVEIGEDRGRFPDAASVQCYGGPAPVSFQSGQMRRVRFRRACNKHLRHALHLWVDQSRRKCVWAGVYYDSKRDQGMTHACALRCLAQRWLKIIWKMWQTRRPYDEALHTRNQVQHGSWLVALT
jgi:transposase